VLQKAGPTAQSAQACLQTCRAEMHARPGFLHEPANCRSCKDKCGVT
jgi:hypothetical protein